MTASKTRPPVPEGPYLVVGLARSGQAAARLLAGRGEQVIGVDLGSPPGAAGLREAGVEVNLDGEGIEQLREARCLVKSPGVPGDAPVVAAARERGMPVLGELELAWRLLPNRFVAVTGTNGKTTATELLGEIWRAAGSPVAVAGNVGTPLASIVGETAADATVICECSSFQLEDADAFAPECAVLLNVSPDHLDRHGSLGRYVEAKLRVFANQQEGDVAVYNGRDALISARTLGGRAERIAFCSHPPGAECHVTVRDGAIVAAGEPLLELSELRLLGRHNVENAMATAGAALAMGIDRDAVSRGITRFAGVPHRLERVGVLADVTYVNDSKATNVAAAEAAILAFEGGVHAILGGSSKGEGFKALAGPIAARCRSCYLIGETADELERDLAPAWEAGIEVVRCEGLEDAVRAAAAASRPGETVLLAPACASFDAYADFEARGEHFRELVEALR
jgi:UDP-N-acetylmuramoylalanine--D-glutamate ligase